MAHLKDIIAAPTASSEYITPKDYSLTEQFKAAFNDFNSLAAIRDGYQDDQARLQFDANAPEDFNPFSGNSDIKLGYEMSYIDAVNDDEVARINHKIDTELLNEEIIATSSLPVVLAAGILDPINLLPLSVLGKGKTALSTAARFAGTTAATETAIEAGFHATQETRTIKESLLNVGFASLLTGTFGGSLVALSKVDPNFDAKNFLARAERDFNDIEGSVGAAKVGDEISKTDLGPAKAAGMEKITSFQDPVSRMASSPAKSARVLVGKLADLPFTRQGAKDGTMAEVPSVENFIKKWDANRGAFVEYLDNAFVRYRSGEASAKSGAFRNIGTGIKDSFIAPSGGKLKKEQFSEEAAKARRRGDVHEIPEIAEAAKVMRDNVIKPLAEEAKKVKKRDGTSLLPDDLDLDGTSNYLMRMWDANKIINNQAKFDALNRQHLMNKRDEALDRVTEWQSLHDKANQLLKDTKKDVRRMSANAKNTLSDAEKKLVRLGADERNARASLRKAEAHAMKLNKRLDKFRPDEITDAQVKKEMNGLLRDIQRGKPANEPKSLSSFIRAQGGIKDPAGELSGMDLTKGTTGLINNKSGKTLDEMTEAALESGYYMERPSTSDLLDDFLDDHMGNVKIYRLGDEDYLSEAQYIDSLIEEFNSFGINIGSIKDGSHLAKVMDSLPDADARYIESTPVTRARYREIQFQARAAQSKISDLEGAVIDIEEKLINAAQDVRDYRAYGKNVAERVKDGRKDIYEQQKAVASIKKTLERDRFYGSLYDEDIADTVVELRNRIVNTPAGRLDYEYKVGAGQSSQARFNKTVVGARGPLKGRVYDIDDLFESGGVKVEDFLVNDIESIANAYSRTMSSQVGMIKSFGSLDMEDEIRAVMSEFETLKARNPTKAVQLQKEQTGAIRDLLALRDRLLGQYETGDHYTGKFAKFARSMKTANFMLYLGGMTLSAIPDVGRPIMVHGINRVYGDGFKALVNNRAALSKAMSQVKEAGTAWDIVLNTRAKAIADIDEFIDHGSSVESWLSRRSGEFSALSLMPHWNASIKQFTGVVAQSRIIDTVNSWVSGGKIKPNDKTFLLDNFISQDYAKRIAAQFERYGENLDGVKVPNAKLWDDKDAAEIFHAAIRKSVDKTIVTPSIDKPLTMSSSGPLGELGPLIFQFKSFALGSMQRTLISGLQQGDMAALNGAMVMVALGSMVYAAKESLAGRELSDDPSKWVVEGVDRSGLGSWFMDVNNITEKMTRGTAGMSALTDDGPMSRYASRNLMGSLMGPSMGTMENLTSVVGAGSLGLANMLKGEGFGKDLSEADTKALRRLLMYQNHFAFGRVFDAAESGVNSAFGVPTRK